VITMGFGKVAISFILISLFALTVVGMFAIMQNDAPTDSYYSNTSNSVTSSLQLSGTVFGVSANLMVPIIAIAGIMMLFSGFVILRKG
jgi:hypothetical protein